MAAVDNPTFDNGTGTYTNTVTVVISDATAGASICYTLDGTDPLATVAGTCDGLTYTDPVQMTVTSTLKAIGTKVGFTNSAVVTGVYTIARQAGVMGSNEAVPSIGLNASTPSIVSKNINS